MKRKVDWAVSVFICLAVLLVMLGVGYYQLHGENDTPLAGSIVEAALGVQVENLEDDVEGEIKTDFMQKEKPIAGENEFAETNTLFSMEKQVQPAVREQSKTSTPVESSGQAANTAEEKPAAPVAVQSSVSEPFVKEVEQKEEENKSEQQPFETETDQPAAVPVPVAETNALEIKVEEAPQKEAIVAPVTYSWGSSGSYTFRMEVKVKNNGSETSRNVRVALPLLENRSPYQTTSLKSVNYSIASTSGRVSTFNLGDIPPGETKTIVADFDITVRTVSINSTNETVEKARQAYSQYAGSGNCRNLARGFISKCREMGIEAREVIGFARPQRGSMTSGSLQGTRHSWAEFYVDGLGWVPVDLTFKYFGSLPHTSHIVESYSDQSLKVNFTGGSLSASWSNLIL
ncbi:MAG: transglutaminase domain-containing protein [Bacillota bacterium]